MPSNLLRVFFHDRCFDGATTAALFGHFFRSTQDPNAEIDYWGMTHAHEPFADVPWDADVNACVDFRFCADPRMHWWFDHHQSAFQPSSLRGVFDEAKSETHFYDPAARSCALFTHEVMKQKLGFTLDDPDGHWNDLLTWADRIDGAVFESAQEIVELKNPAFHLMIWLRSNRDPEKMSRTIEKMGRVSIAELVALPWIAKDVPALLEAHQHSVALIGKRLKRFGPVVAYDLAEDDIEAHSGFAAYMHEPSATYSVGLVHSDKGAGISVGCNPWAPVVGPKNIASICEHYGGGGHPNVGGIAVAAGQLDRAREIVAEIVETLRE